MASSRHADDGQLMDTNRVEEDKECFESIDKLISQGINAGDVKKMQDAGICTCNELMMHSKKTLTGIEGLSEAKVDKIWEAAEKLLNQGFMAESDLLLKKSVGTGSQEVDESVMGTVEGFLVKHFPDRKTFMKKNYELKPQQITEIDEKRLGGYQKILMYGLGSAFFGAASGVLDKLDTKSVHWFTIYFTFSLVLMLKGLSATLFPYSTPSALGTASFCAWIAYVYILATFHIASLKFHQHVNHCKWSMGISTIFLTLHWGYSAQEPLIFHIISKAALWIVLAVLWFIVIVLKIVINFFALLKSALGSLSSNQENSLKTRLIRRNHGNRTGDRKSSNV